MLSAGLALIIKHLGAMNVRGSKSITCELDVWSRCVVVRLMPHGGTRYGTGSPRQRHDD